MIINIMCSLGIGMVCGWLTGMMVCHGNRLLRNILILVLANILIGAWIVLLLDWLAILVFLGSALVFLLTYLKWQSVIRNHLSN